MRSAHGQLVRCEEANFRRLAPTNGGTLPRNRAGFRLTITLDVPARWPERVGWPPLAHRLPVHPNSPQTAQSHQGCWEQASGRRGPRALDAHAAGSPPPNATPPPQPPRCVRLLGERGALLLLRKWPARSEAGRLRSAAERHPQLRGRPDTGEHTASAAARLLELLLDAQVVGVTALLLPAVVCAGRQAGEATARGSQGGQGTGASEAAAAYVASSGEGACRGVRRYEKRTQQPVLNTRCAPQILPCYCELLTGSVAPQHHGIGQREERRRRHK